MDDAWREEYKQLKNLTDIQIKVLDEGAKSLAQSWMLNAMHQDYKRIKGITDPEPPDCSSSFQEWNQRVEEQEEK